MRFADYLAAQRIVERLAPPRPRRQHRRKEPAAEAAVASLNHPLSGRHFTTIEPEIHARLEARGIDIEASFEAWMRALLQPEDEIREVMGNAA